MKKRPAPLFMGYFSPILPQERMRMSHLFARALVTTALGGQRKRRKERERREGKKNRALKKEDPDLTPKLVHLVGEALSSGAGCREPLEHALFPVLYVCEQVGVFRG